MRNPWLEHTTDVSGILLLTLLVATRLPSGWNTRFPASLECVLPDPGMPLILLENLNPIFLRSRQFSIVENSGSSRRKSWKNRGFQESLVPTDGLIKDRPLIEHSKNYKMDEWNYTKWCVQVHYGHMERKICIFMHYSQLPLIRNATVHDFWIRFRVPSYRKYIIFRANSEVKYEKSKHLNI